MTSTRSTKEDWLKPGATDLAEAVVEDVPVKGQTVKVRGLAAAYANEAQSKAMTMKTGRGQEQTAVFDTHAMDLVKFVHGCVEPTFTYEEAQQVARTHGPSFQKIVEKIDELSGIDSDAMKDVVARFPDSGNGAKEE